MNTFVWILLVASASILFGLGHGAPNASVSVSSVTVTVGLNETTSRTFSVTNVGDAELVFRLRDSGSSAGLRQVFPSRVLAQYPSGFQQNIYFMDFDGLGLWRAPSANSLEWVSLDPPAVKRTLTVSGIDWDLSYDTAWDGQGLWVTKAASGADLRTRLARLDPYPQSGNTAVPLNHLTTLPNGYNLARVAWDGAQAWYIYYSNPLTVNGSTLAVTPRNGIRSLTFIRGACWYADSLWGFGFVRPGGSADSRFISSINVTNAARTDYFALESEIVNADMAAQATDGFGRFLSITKASSITPFVVTHYDLGIRYWMTCPDQTHEKNALGVFEAKTFTLQFDSTNLRPGEYKTLLWVDSNDPAKRRVTIPINFVVENRAPAAPTAQNDIYLTDRDTTLQISSPGVLQNDTGAAPLAAMLLTEPAAGTLSLFSNGSFIYVPPSRFVGSVSFTYRVRDGLNRFSSTGTVQIQVREVPHIQISPTTVSVQGTENAQTETQILVANIGFGSLKISVVDSGATGGTVGPFTLAGRASLLPKSTSHVAWDGVDWYFTHMAPNSIARYSSLGVFLDSFSVDTDGAFDLMAISWADDLLWVTDSVSYVNGPGGTLVPGRAPRLLAYDRFGRLNSTFTLPFQSNNWLPTMAYDAVGSLYIHNFNSATWRFNIRTRVLTTLPTLQINVMPGDMAFYANSIWFKEKGNILRFNPASGQQIGSWAWPSAGSTVPTANNLMYAFVSGGFGRFWVAGGASPNLQLILVDSGLRSWLSVAPESLTVVPGTSQSLNLTLHGDRASVGSFSTQLVLLSNDVDSRTVVVPVSFVVSAAAPALLSPTRAPASAPIGQPSAVPSVTPVSSPPRAAPASAPIANPLSAPSRPPAISVSPSAPPAIVPPPVANPATAPFSNPSPIAAAPRALPPASNPITAPSFAPSAPAPVAHPALAPSSTAPPIAQPVQMPAGPILVSPPALSPIAPSPVLQPVASMVPSEPPIVPLSPAQQPSVAPVVDVAPTRAPIESLPPASPPPVTASPIFTAGPSHPPVSPPEPITHSLPVASASPTAAAPVDSVRIDQANNGNGGAIAGAIIGTIAAVALIAAATFFAWKKFHKKP